MSNGYITIPRSLFDHPAVTKATHIQLKILLYLLNKMCYSECDYNDHGCIIKLQPLQCAFTMERLAEAVGTNRTTAWRGTRFFEKHKILKQEVKHLQTIVTFTYTELCELEKKKDETRRETRMKQDWQKSETQKNKVNNNKVNNNNGDDDDELPPSSAVVVSIQEGWKYIKDYSNNVLPCMLCYVNSPVDAKILESTLQIIGLSDEDIIFLKKRFTIERVDLAMKFVQSSDVKTTPMRTIVWHCKQDNPPEPTKKKPDLKTVVKANFKHGEIYNGAECFISEDGVAFQRGMNYQALRFSDKGAKEQFHNMLRKLDIPLPQEETA